MKKLMRKMRERKGFTLAELLIVVAIIAVLVAISIPIFTTQLEKARDATDAANLRAAYAEVVAAHLLNDSDTTTKTVKQKGTDTTNANFTEFNSDFSVADPTTANTNWTVKYNSTTSKVEATK